SAGLIHNLATWNVKGLEYEDFEDAYFSTVGYHKQRWGSGFDSSAFVDDFPISFFEDLIADSSNNYNNIIDNTSFSNDMKDFIGRLVTDLKDTASLPANFAYDDIKDIVLDWESDAIASHAFSEAELSTLSHIGSVGRFSTLFWHDMFSDEWSKMSSQEQQAAGKKRKWWQWLIVGVCDVVGAVAGATVNPGVAVATGASASVGAATIINWGAE
ncbi:MAG TPA: hypothetical protein VI461_11670, partial [Chitinophagaceae bacterium]|nr:hypothetical protein [Chitinophagaceae bacterium]